jgi:rod shape-determining protein MreC
MIGSAKVLIKEPLLNFFNLDIRKILLILPILSLPLITINMQQTPRPTEWYGQPFAYLASLSQNSYFIFATEIKHTTALYLNLIDIKKENAHIKNENSELKTQLTAMTELKLENERLNQLFQFKQKTKMELMAAKVVARDLNSDHGTLVINRGSQEGIKPGLAVMTIEGAVGYIFRVENTTSRVMLITDRYSVVDGIVQRSRARGLVEGKASETCQLKYVNKSNDVVTGDLVVTSGLDNLFPKGLPIATVELVNKRPYGVNLEVELKPIVNPNKLEELFIVLNPNQQDLTPKNSAALAPHLQISPDQLIPNTVTPDLKPSNPESSL